MILRQKYLNFFGKVCNLWGFSTSNYSECVLKSGFSLQVEYIK